MRVALLTRSMPSANAFVRRLESAGELALVVVERSRLEPSPSSPSRSTSPSRSSSPGWPPTTAAVRLLATVRGAALRPTAHRVVDRLLDRLADPRAEEQAREVAAIQRVYGERARPVPRSTPIATIEHRAWATAVPLLERARPDVVVVFGTSWLPDAVTAVARLATINVHAGLAPHYRGNRCVEHAILAGDLDNVGVTLHLVRPALDAGELVVQRRPQLQADDDEHVLAHRVLDAGQAAFAELLSALDGGARLAPRAQPPDVGTYFPIDAYTPGHRRLVRALIEGGLVARYLERRAAGRTREKPILEALQLE